MTESTPTAAAGLALSIIAPSLEAASRAVRGAGLADHVAQAGTGWYRVVLPDGNREEAERLAEWVRRDGLRAAVAGLWLIPGDEVESDLFDGTLTVAEIRDDETGTVVVDAQEGCGLVTATGRAAFDPSDLRLAAQFDERFLAGLAQERTRGENFRRMRAESERVLAILTEQQREAVRRIGGWDPGPMSGPLYAPWGAVREDGRLRDLGLAEAHPDYSGCVVLTEAGEDVLDLLRLRGI